MSDVTYEIKIVEKDGNFYWTAVVSAMGYSTTTAPKLMESKNKVDATAEAQARLSAFNAILEGETNA